MKEYNFENFCLVKSSKRIFANQYTNAGIPFYRGKEITLLSMGQSIYDLLYISEQAFQQVKTNGMPENNDILITAVGTIGSIWLVDTNTPFYFKDGNIIWLSKINQNIVLPKYLKYAMISSRFQKKIEEVSIGSNQKALTIDSVKKLQISFPKIETQQHIVDILGSIDAKIENNQKKVDLLLKNLRLQFIVRFTKQELTKSTALSYFITETIGGDWGKETAQGNYSERVVCLRGADIPEIASGKNGDPPTRYILPKNLLTKQLAPWEIIVEISGGSPTQSTGRCALITSEMLSNYSTPIICTNFCRAIRCKNPQFAAYVYSLLIAMYNNNLFFNYENGTTGIKNLDLSSILEKEYVYLPSEDELESFYIFTSKTYKQIEQHKTENNKLNELKQLYLKKFFG